MQLNESAGLESRERLRQRLRDTHVTAHTGQSDDGTTRTVYRAGGCEYGSVDALASALGNHHP